MLTDEEIIRAGYMHTVETDEPLFTFDRPELLAMVRELLAAHNAEATTEAVRDGRVAQTALSKAELSALIRDIECLTDGSDLGFARVPRATLERWRAKFEHIEQATTNPVQEVQPSQPAFSEAAHAHRGRYEFRDTGPLETGD